MQVNNWRKYPICLLGYDIRRWERCEGFNVYFPEYERKLLANKSYPDIGPTHLQYRSPFGFLITWPFCIHVWIQFREQTLNNPGSEIVLYGRMGARWDAGACAYMFPSFYVGGVWD